MLLLLVLFLLDGTTLPSGSMLTQARTAMLLIAGTVIMTV